MSPGLSLFTACGIYFQSTGRPEPKQPILKKHSIHCVQEAKIKPRAAALRERFLDFLIWYEYTQLSGANREKYLSNSGK